jgi:hypothetical protein
MAGTAGWRTDDGRHFSGLGLSRRALTAAVVGGQPPADDDLRVNPVPAPELLARGVSRVSDCRRGWVQPDQRDSPKTIMGKQVHSLTHNSYRVARLAGDDFLCFFRCGPAPGPPTADSAMPASRFAASVPGERAAYPATPEDTPQPAPAAVLGEARDAFHP